MGEAAKRRVDEGGPIQKFKNAIFRSLKITFFAVPAWIGITSFNSEDSGFFGPAVLFILVPALLIFHAVLLLLAAPFNEGAAPRQPALMSAGLITVYYILILVLGAVFLSKEIAEIPLPINEYKPDIGIWERSQLSFVIPKVTFWAAILVGLSLVCDRVIHKIRLRSNK